MRTRRLTDSPNRSLKTETWLGIQRLAWVSRPRLQDKIIRTLPSCRITVLSVPDFMSNDHGISPSAAANSSSGSIDMGSTQTVGIQALLDDITGNHCDQLDITNLDNSRSDTSERNGPTATHLSPYETALSHNSREHAPSIHRQRRRYSAGQGQAPITPTGRRKRRYSAEERFEVAERRHRPCLTDHKVRKVKV